MRDFTKKTKAIIPVHLYGKACDMTALKKIAKMANVSYNTIGKNIISFGRRREIHKPSFPFKMTSLEGASFRLIINSEGHISEQIGRSVMIRVPEIQMLKKSISFSKKLFGQFPIEIKKTKGKNTHEIYLPGEIGDILVTSGLARGRKSIKNLPIPRDILQGSLDIKRAYLQWSLAGEMECTRNSNVLKLTRYVNVSHLLPTHYKKTLNAGANFKKDIPTIMLKKLATYPPQLLIGECFLLKDFGITRYPYIVSLWKYKNGGVSCAWTVSITNKKETSILYHQIGLPLVEKRKKVKKFCL